MVSHDDASAIVDDADNHLLLNCTASDILKALCYCANTAAGPDGILFRIIKQIAHYIFLCLLQLSFSNLSRKASFL